MVEYIVDSQKGKPTRCPICGEIFRPAPQHIKERVEVNE